ncbi:CDP-glycerol glycerophosphotransferase family protein [Alkalimonas sp. MEB108]|uniref:CDP-glycerol glycerophosphotransferase family protein n=1 Tax=Alkalimonas cellulosilytica TaxID=3058395 RepID=A0ABU7J4T9_9GAMM|nr:CDP-glycerol glycerophosphotransferase family protein [Alkalimonas sp. MEB108]MEE2001523.1 CDP-glycerol glycerophosphotransferase family protein [Alkalimonas sp. MEB108]
MINFNLTTSKNYLGVQSQLNTLIQKHLPAGSYTETTLEYVEGALNFTMFVMQQADVLMSHGAADKNYHWKKYANKSFVNEQTRRKHLFVPGNLLVDRISQSRKLPSFNRTNVHSVGWPRLDALIALQNEYDKVKPATGKKNVLWAPTHDYNRKGANADVISSYPDFEPYMEQLAVHYDVNVSLHPRNRKDKKPTYQQLLEADVVISDLGTMVWEAWALGKTLIFPDWIIKERMLKHKKNSAEWRIFAEDYGLHASSIEHMKDVIAESPAMDTRTKEFFEYYLDPKYLGCSGKRIADLLLALDK